MLDQLAGDEVADNPEGLVAAGFLRLGVYEYNQRDARGQWNDIMNEKTDVAGDVFFGMSIACARCHQHKFDPIPQRDYFKLRAPFSSQSYGAMIWWRLLKNKRRHTRPIGQVGRSCQADQRSDQRFAGTLCSQEMEVDRRQVPLDIQACFNLPKQDRTSWQDQMAYLVSRQYMEEGGGPLKA